jgi:hypothetical protein
MQSNAQRADASKRSQLTGRIISGLVVLLLLFDSIAKLFKEAHVLKAQVELGIPESLTVAIGTILIVCTVLYAIPRTSILGAVLLTGYLGGAVAVKLRIGDPIFGQVLFPVYMGIAAWAGLYLRDHRLRRFLSDTTQLSIYSRDESVHHI